MTTRVLVFQSVEDDITERRLRRMRESSSLQSYEFTNIFAIEITDEERQLHPYELMEVIEPRELDTASLLTRLNAAISNFDPDVLVVHSGFAFLRYHEEILGVLMHVRENHPSLTLVLENLSFVSKAYHDTLFTTDPEFLLLAESIFRG